MHNVCMLISSSCSRPG